MKQNIFKIFLLIGITAFGFWSCQLGQNPTPEERVSFVRIYDSLAKFDSVDIVFKNKNGAVLDTLFHGKVDSKAKIENLVVKNWDGGEALVEISGYNGGVLVSKTGKNFDGRIDKADSTSIVYIVSNTTLSTPNLEISMSPGDTLSLPEIVVKPNTISDKSVKWKSSNNEILLLSVTNIKALKIGLATLTAALMVYTTKYITIKVTVMANGKIPDSLNLSADTLFLAAGGAPEQLTVTSIPITASIAVVWTLKDSSLASVDAMGSVLGLKKGTTLLRATSKENGSVSDSAWVVISDPIHAESVHFTKDSVTIFVGGVPESLMVVVLPPKANPSVEFSLLDLNKVELKANRISGLIAGFTSVVAKSKENPLLADTLIVHVISIQHIDSVRILPRTLKLFTGGETGTMTGNVYPLSASQLIKWKTSDVTMATIDANGIVTPKGPGRSRILAISLADSTIKDSVEILVKTDMPQVTIGQDTSVSVGSSIDFLPIVAMQEYGLVTQFKWDLDGIPGWDDSSASVHAVSHKYDTETEMTAKFLIRDTEKNETVVSKKVKAVKGLIVIITLPKDKSYSNQADIAVNWTINGQEQSLQKTESLKDGLNTITRSSKDAAGTLFSTSITVTLDMVAPNKPTVRGSDYTSSTLPTWKWTSGGAGGVGIYRVALDVESFTSAVEFKDTVYTPTTALTEAVHTVFVQERDFAGNWSPSGKFITQVDFSPPAKPNVHINTPAITNNTTPKWGWVSGGGGSGNFQYKLDINDFTTGATPTTDTTFMALAPMTNGLHSVYVRERDSSGNWSDAGSASVTISTVIPASPKVTGSTPTNSAPTWNWTSGSGTAGNFRYKLNSADLTSGATVTKLLTFTSTTTLTSGDKNTLYVQEQDAAGNWSTSGSLEIVYDLTKPVVSVTTPASVGTYFTTGASLALTGTAGGGPAAISKITYAYTVAGAAGGNGNAVVAAGTGDWSIASIPLVENQLTVITITVTNAIGNTGTATFSAQKDITLPNPPSFTANPPANTSAKLGSWTWKAGTDVGLGSGLNGNYRYRLNAGGWVSVTTTLISGLVMKEGTNTFEVQEQDNASNWSASISNLVLLDTKGPELAITSPVVAGQTYNETAKLDVQIKGSVVDTGVGVKSVTCELTGATSGSPIVSVSAGTWSVTPTFKSGTTKITCTAYDAFDQATSGFINVSINIPKPVISALSIPSGYVTSKSTFEVSYTVTVEGKLTGTEHTSIVLTKANKGNNLFTLTSIAKNIAGEPGTLEVQYFYRDSVIFLNASATGDNDGTSWANGYTLLKKALADPKIKTPNTQIWASKGTYAYDYTTDGYSNSIELPSTALSMIAGGFDASQLPSDTTLRNRNINKTILLGYKLSFASLGSNFELNGLELNNNSISVGNSLINDLSFTIRNCKIYGFQIVENGFVIRSDLRLALNMIGCDVTSSETAHQFQLQFRSPSGTFNAQDCTFNNSYQTGYELLTIASESISTFPSQVINFDRCYLNFAVSPGDFQIKNYNPYSTTTVSNSPAVLGGCASISSVTPLIYKNNPTSCPYP